MVLTKKEIASWSGAVMREKMQDPAVREAMRNLGIPVLEGSWQDIQAQAGTK